MRVTRGLLFTCLFLVTTAVPHPQKPQVLTQEEVLASLRTISSFQAAADKFRGRKQLNELVKRDKVNFLLTGRIRRRLEAAGATPILLNLILYNGPDSALYEKFSLHKRAGNSEAAKRTADEYKNKFAGRDEARDKETNDFIAAYKPPPPPTPTPLPVVEQHRQKLEQGKQALKSNPPGYADAEQAFKDAKSLLPDDPRAFYHLGQLYSAQSLYDKAITELEGARKLKSNDPLIHSALGIAHFHKKNYAGAAESLKDAVTSGAADADTYLYLGKARNNLKLFEDAVVAFKRASEIGSADAQLHFEVGGAYFKLNQPTEAFDSYNRAVDVNPAFIDAAKKLVDLKPRDPKAQERLGDAYLSAKKYQEAKAAYDKVVSLSPNFRKESRAPVGLMHIGAAEHVGGVIERVTGQIKLAESANVVLNGSEFQGPLTVCMNETTYFTGPKVTIAKKEPNTDKCTQPSAIKVSDIDKKRRYVDFTHNNKNYVMAITAFTWETGSSDDYIEFVIFRKVTP